MAPPVVAAPLISVGVPVYNDALFLGRALEDLAAQTFKDFEVIISDNASTDSTPEICQAFTEKFAFFRYVRQDGNIGPQRNFQFVLEKARGRYFVWAASDDRRDPDFLRSLMSALQGNSAATSAFCEFANIDNDDRPIGSFDFDYSSPYRTVRLAKFLFEPSARRDVLFYGLHRTEVLQRAVFYRWWGANAVTPIRVAYPIVAHLLAHGPYVHVPRVLFHSRMAPERARSYAGLGGGWRGLARLNLLELNAHYALWESVYRATGSLLAAAAALPVVVASLARALARGNWQPVRQRVRRLLTRGSPAVGTD